LIFICISFIFEISRTPFSNGDYQHISNIRAKNEYFDNHLILIFFMRRMAYAATLHEGAGGNFCRMENNGCEGLSGSIHIGGANMRLFGGES
jgi:hypothetical protein